MESRAPLAVRETTKDTADGTNAPAARTSSRVPAGPANAGHHFGRIAVERIAPPPPPPIQRAPVELEDDEDEEEEAAPASTQDYFSSLFAKGEKQKKKAKLKTGFSEVDPSKVTPESVAELDDKKLVAVIDILTYDDSEDSEDDEAPARTPYGGRRPSVVPRPKAPRVIDPAKRAAVRIALAEARRRRLPLKPGWTQFFMGGGPASAPSWLSKKRRGPF